MSIETLKSALPDYARDLKLNLSSLAGEETLTAQQLWGSFVASAIASRNPLVIEAIETEAKAHLSAEALTAARAAAAIMAMNNIYYRFVHLSSNQEYHTMPARLRMNVIGKPGVDKVDFELWSLAVSAINGCGMCIDAHEHELRKGGLKSEAIQAAIRIAAVVHAVAVTLEGDAVAQQITNAQEAA
ncbi:MAG: carboxymuconolactone decarboxylase family protein [Alphaproteobacteria bacterium]|nr:carboxymuconolactone decarboxylase family protein [Alphaproteobacteria bacterium]MBU0799005.1 carboxymuconolactone decarboxylase family protein [Alphaproteobacteria bacterium]MBU0889235.1 carboxymuconolactone decarboxylase family protein [Alphaproteobacteria bacterium]MBU1815051.1 carboxymuconolactone decarboxylase family protein [Alphaproteobacteria bacterium]